MYKNFKTNIGSIVVLLAIAGGLILVIYPPAFFSPRESRVAALAIVAIGFWATMIIPEHLTALLFFFLAMIFSLAPANVVFSGFESTAMWLIFGGLVIGVGITGTGLGNRIADKVVVHLNGNYLRIISGVVIAGVLFSFLMPSSMGRIIFLIPVTLAIADHFDFAEGSNGRIGIVLAATLGAVIPAYAILPSNVVNMVLVGMAETQFNISPLYGEYLALHFPVLGLLKSLVIIGLIVWMYPDKPGKAVKGEMKTTRPMSKNEVLLSVILIVLLALWITDFIHHISPAWIALGGAVLLLMPRINIVTGKQFNENINYGSLFFVAGILGLGGMVSHSGLGDMLAQKLIASFPLGEDRPFINYMSLSLASLFTAVGATIPGAPAVITPLSDQLSVVTGWSIKTIIMTQMLGFSTVIFPYQVPSIVIGMQLSGEKLSSAIKVCFILAAITIFFLLPINYFWWKALGWL
ncbi:MAG: anion permease [Deltaproteobacteria bacterium]|nr:anion permease [Deltaproteobacteria bacterium]